MLLFAVLFEVLESLSLKFKIELFWKANGISTLDVMSSLGNTNILSLSVLLLFSPFAFLSFLFLLLWLFDLLSSSFFSLPVFTKFIIIS